MRESEPAFRRPVALALGALVAAGIVFRLYRLGALPGLNGDEAWYGAQAEGLLHGEGLSLTTPSGAPLNPFFMAPQIVLNGVADASVTLLRVPAAISGIVALAANFLFCRRLWGSRTAALSTTLLAALPLAIAYSRFGWDASQTALASMLVVYPALLSRTEAERRTRWLAVSWAAWLASLLVHPTNAFLVGFPALASIPWLKSRRLQAAGHVLAAAPTVVVNERSLHVWPPQFLEDGAITGFLHDYLRIASGDGVYSYISGGRVLATEVILGLTLGDLMAAAVLIAVAVGAARLMRTDSALRLLAGGLVAGWLFHLWAVSPNYTGADNERYRMFLVVPTVLIAGRVAASVRGGVAATVAVSCLLLAGFAASYLHPLASTGGTGRPPFHAAETDPKERALQLVEERDGRERRTVVVGLDYWVDWPFRYFSLDRGNDAVAIDDSYEFARRGPIQEVARQGPVWFAGLSGVTAMQPLADALEKAGVPFQVVTVRRRDGNPAVVMLRVPRRSGR